MIVVGMIQLLENTGHFSEYIATTADCACCIANDLDYDTAAVSYDMVNNKSLFQLWMKIHHLY